MGYLFTRYRKENDGVTNDWSVARVDPLAALLIQTGKYQAVVSRAT